MNHFSLYELQQAWQALGICPTDVLMGTANQQAIEQWILQQRAKEAAE